MKELFKIFKRAPLDPTDGFLLLHAALFTFGDEPALASDGAKNAALDDLLAEALEQGILPNSLLRKFTTVNSITSSRWRIYKIKTRLITDPAEHA